MFIPTTLSENTYSCHELRHLKGINRHYSVLETLRFIVDFEQLFAWYI